MRISRMMGLGLLAATTAMTGCKNSVKTENDNLKAENKSLRDQLSDRNKALDESNGELRSRDQQLAELRKGMSGAAGTGGSTGFENIPGVNASSGAGEVTASVESDLLFDSGKTTLKAAAKKSLDAVASVLNSTYSGSTIRVGGHTDSDPIRKSGFKSNDHLGFERAFAVKEYLISKGVNAKRVYCASYGPNSPKSSKPQSRRVEIVVLLNGTTATASATGQ